VARLSERITMQALADSGSNPFAYRIQSNKAGGAPLIYHNWDAHPSLSISEGGLAGVGLSKRRVR